MDELIAPPKPGSRRVEFYGNKFSVNKALGAMQYRTDLNYNRLSRNTLCYPPPLEKTVACRSLPVPFDPTTNDVDTMLVIADDMGNSGGTERQPQISRRSIEILPEAVNDRPRIHAPMQAIAVEDWAFSFVNPDQVGFAGLALPEPVYYKEFVDQQCFYMQRDDGTRPPVDVNGLDQECGCTRQCAVPVHNQFSMTSCACNNDDCTLTCDTLQGTRLKALLGDRIKSIRGRQGPAIYLSDPDYLDFGFEFLPVEVNISVQHGRVMLNEAFLSQKDILGVRIVPRYYAGLSNPLASSTRGLYHERTSGNTDCDLCVGGWHWVDGRMLCCDGVEKSLWRAGVCRACPYWGTGDKFISITGTLADVNLALSNVTYINDRDFNTRYGLKEALLIEVSDEGALGNQAPTPDSSPLRSLWEIELEVESVNDPPVISRLEAVLKDSVADDEKVTDIYVLEERPLNASLHYVEVDEDQFHTFNHTLLWVSDVDASEAETITTLFRCVVCCGWVGGRADEYYFSLCISSSITKQSHHHNHTCTRTGPKPSRMTSGSTTA